MFRKTMMKNNKSKGSVSSEHKEIVRDDILQYELLEGNGPKGAPKGDPIMQVRDLHVSFATEAGVCRAVRGVNFDLWRGRTLGIVGESGSGKSVTALSLIGLLDDNAKVTGSIIMNGEELIGKTDKDLGWHLSNLEMDQTEKCVLEHGEPVHDGQGRCIARGRQHAITFSKYPIYQGTEIVGLLGESCSSSRSSPPSRSSTGRPSDALYCAASAPSSARTCPPPS